VLGAVQAEPTAEGQVHIVSYLLRNCESAQTAVTLALPQEIKAAISVAGSIKDAIHLQDPSRCKRTTEQRAAETCLTAGSIRPGATRAEIISVASLFGIRARVMHGAARRRMAIEDGLVGWCIRNQKPMSNKIDRSHIINWWHEHCQPRTANKSDCVLVPVAGLHRTVEPHQRRTMVGSLVKNHEQYKAWCHKKSISPAGLQVVSECLCRCIRPESKQDCVCPVCHEMQLYVAQWHKARKFWRTGKKTCGKPDCKLCTSDLLEAASMAHFTAAVVACGKVDIAGRKFFSLKCAEQHGCTCLADFKTMVQGCALEYTTEQFTYNCYRTISKGKWSQKMVVPTDYKGDSTTRRDFLKDMLELTDTYFPHKFTHHWQQYSMDMKDESITASDLAVTADFIEAFEHGAKTNVVCEKVIRTRMLALCMQHGPRGGGAARAPPAKKARWAITAKTLHGVAEFTEGDVPAHLRQAFELDMHLCMSDKKNQDTLSYSSWLVPLLEKYKVMFGQLEHHEQLQLIIVQSDRCKGQFWGRRAFLFIATFSKTLAGVLMCADSTCAYHGKGRSDGIGAWGKTTADRAELRGVRLVNKGALVKQLRKEISRGWDYGELGFDYDKQAKPVEVDCVSATRVGMWDGDELAATFQALGGPSREQMPDCEPFPGSDAMHSVRGSAECKGAWFRRFSCWCAPCKRKNYAECTTRQLLGIWNEEQQSYINDWVYLPLVPKQPTAQDRIKSADEYASGLDKDSWVVIDCSDSDDDHGWWLALVLGKAYKATAEVQTADGAMNIKEGYPVLDVAYFERYDPADSNLFKPENLKDTVHTESLIVVDTAIMPEKVSARSVKIRLPDACAAAILRGLEARRPTVTPTWVPA
jgi:hypothetical protein